MIDPNPKWSYTTPNSTSQWYGHVHLTGEHAVGEWLVVERKTGKCLWDRKFRRPTTIYAIEGDYILANETRSDGPWTLNFGCYCISLKTGELLWQWHGKGIGGAIVRLCDYVPDFTNELRPRFLGVKGSHCLVTPNRVLDIKTGRPTSFSGDPLTLEKKLATSRAQHFYQDKRIEISPGRELTCSVVVVKNGFHREAEIEFSLGSEWRWGPRRLGLKSGTNFYSWRLLDDNRLLLVAGDESDTIPDPRYPEKYYSIPNPTHYQLIVLDVLTGSELQRIPVSAEKIPSCRMEDVDAEGVLINVGGKLIYYSFQMR